MKKILILLIVALFSFQLSAQDTCGSNNNNQYKWLKRQCFDKQIKLLYATPNQAAILNANGEVVTIPYQQLADSIGLDSNIWATKNFVENYQSTLADSSKYRYCVSGWVPSLQGVAHTAEGGVVNIGGDTLVNVFSKNFIQNHYGDSSFLAIRYSYNGGLTWTNETILFDSAFDDRNPSIGWVNGKIVVWFIQRETLPIYSLKGLGYIVSSDRGATWSTFVPFTPIKPGICSPYGSIIKNPKPTGEWAVLVRNTDWCEIFKTFDGNTWVSGGLIYDAPSPGNPLEEPSFEYVAPDTLIGLLRGADSTYYQMVSFDNFATLSLPIRTNINPGQIFGQSPLNFYDSTRKILISLGCERRETSYTPYNDRINIYANSVSDVINNPKGYTFISYIDRPTPNVIPLYGYPAMTKLKDSSIFVMFTDRTVETGGNSISSVNENASLYQFDINFMGKYPLSKSCSCRYDNLSPVYNNVININELKPIKGATYFNPQDTCTQPSNPGRFKLYGVHNFVPILDIRDSANRKLIDIYQNNAASNVTHYSLSDKATVTYNNAQKYSITYSTNAGASIVGSSIYSLWNTTNRLLNVSSQGEMTFSGKGLTVGATPNVGSYGMVFFNSTASVTSFARPYMVTNAFKGRFFAIIRGVNATTPPQIDAPGTNFGQLVSGVVDFCIDQNGNIGMGDTIPGHKLSVGGNASIRDTLLLRMIPAVTATRAKILTRDSVLGRVTGLDIYTRTATLDFPSTLAATSSDLTITVQGAASGDIVTLGVPNGSVVANSNYTAWVSATNTVSVRLNNYSASPIDPSSGTFSVRIIK